MFPAKGKGQIPLWGVTKIAKILETFLITLYEYRGSFTKS